MSRPVSALSVALGCTQTKAGGGKRGGSKLRPGGGGSLLSEPGFPGAVPGGEAERSAFWIVMEV